MASEEEQEENLADTVNIYADDNMRLLDLLGLGEESERKKAKTKTSRPATPKAAALRLTWQRTPGLSITDHGDSVSLRAVALEDEWSFARLFGFVSRGELSWTAVVTEKDSAERESMAVGVEGNDGSRLLLNLSSGETQDASNRMEQFVELPETGFFPRGTRVHFKLSIEQKKLLIGVGEFPLRPAFRLQCGVAYVPVVAMRLTGQKLRIVDMQIINAE